MGTGAPLVIAYHLIWTSYGWWLPNDPRGGGSQFITSDIVSQLGELHWGRKKIQPAGRVIREFYEQAHSWLKHEPRLFSMQEIHIIASAISECIAVEKYTCWACAVMPDHVHILIRKHRDSAEEMIMKLKALSRKRLIEGANSRFPGDHPIWAGGHGWKVFLDHPDEVHRTIRYVQKNPAIGQSWNFVKPYDNWPLHPGHSPNSPYVKSLRAAGRL